MNSNVIEKYSQIFGSPFLSGIFLWVNAIKDVALFVDGPDCVFYKADMIYKTHDLFSNLKDSSENTKVYFSGVMPNKMVRWYDEDIKRKLSYIDKNNNFNLWIITCMPVTWLLANQYSNIYSDFKKDFIFVPSYTDKFRIDGYSIFLKELAKYMTFDNNIPKKKYNISIVGNMFDRNEWDCKWNIEEIKRILSSIWVEINTIWLNWSDISDLKQIEYSELIVVLPYWKLAADLLSKKLWVESIELDIPFWLKNTIEFVSKIGNRLWIDKKIIDNYINKELKEIKSKIDLIDEKIFLNKNYAFAWDPFLEKSVKDIWDYLWMNLVKSYYYNWSKQAKKEEFDNINLDLVIWNWEFYIEKKDDYVRFEFWFPSYKVHFLLSRPYMWFKWLQFFIERLYYEMIR